MSVVHNQYNQYVSSTVGTVGVGGTLVYFTLPWQPASIVDRVRFWNTSGNAINVSNIVIYNNAAHFRAGDQTNRDQTIYADGTSTVIADNFYSSYFNLNPGVYVEELYYRPYLHVKAYLASSVSNSTYYCAAYGRKAMPTTYINADKNQITTMDDYRVLVGRAQGTAGGIGGTIFDVTGVARKNGGENASELAFKGTNDYIYVGSDIKTDHWDFVVKTPTVAGTALSAQIWAGSGWSSITLYDNTAHGIGTTGSLRYSGVVEGAGLGASMWAPTVLDPAINNQLPNDPLTVQYNAIKAGTALPQYLPPNQPRYWVRFRLSDVTNAANTGGTAEIYNIYPITETY